MGFALGEIRMCKGEMRMCVRVLLLVRQVCVRVR